MEIFEMEKEFDALMKKGQELIEKMKENQRKTKRWKPTLGDTFFHITNTTHIDSMRYLTGNSHVCEKIFKTGNCFKTEEQAKKELDRRVAERELLNLCDWEDCACAEIMYDFGDKEFSVGFPCTENCYSPYRFATKESCKRAIDMVGEDKLKLIFRIED